MSTNNQAATPAPRTTRTNKLSLSTPKPAPHLSDEEVKRKYPRMRIQVFMGIFIGYAGYYLVRNNIPLVAQIFEDKDIYNSAQYGYIGTAVLISYGLSKFFMATLSDRSNARLFMPLGLILSALINIGIGFIPWLSSSLAIFAIVMFINGWVQGMGWPPAGRELVFWWSTSERGRVTSVWNTAHNVGGAGVGLAAAWILQRTGDDWYSAFWFPGFIAIIVAIIAFFLIRDNPESEGLPPIDQFHNDPPKVDAIDDELANTPYWTIIRKYVLTNRVVVVLALANVFVYVLRYGVLYWTPLYLGETRGANIKEGILGFVLFELAGIIGTVFCGWASDKIFKGNRTATGIVFLFAAGLCIAAYWLTPRDWPLWISYVLVALIGAFIYGPVMLVGLQAIDLTPRNIAGTAAGFTGLFGYLLGATMASAGAGVIKLHFGFTWLFIFFLVCTALGILCLCTIYKDEKQLMTHREEVKAQLDAVQNASQDA